MPPADDAGLIRQVAAGDHAAFRTLLDRHGKYLFGVAHALLGNGADAEDVVQETFAAALGGGFRGESSVRTWLVRILMNRAGMVRRRRGRDAEGIAKPQATAGGSSKTDAKLDLSTMLDALSAEHREVIVLRELERLSYEDMAKALGVPRGTVESRLHRAREELRKRFRGYF